MNKIVLAGLLTLVVFTTGCSSDDSAAAPSELATGLGLMTGGMGASMDSDGADLGASSFMPNGSRALVDTVCKDSGYAYANGDAGAPALAPAQGTAEYAARNIYCNLRKSPDGPDTVRGAMDRVKGFICAVGNPAFDGVARAVTVGITTACFSQAFVDTAAAEGFSSVVVAVTGYSDPSVAAFGGNATYDKGILVDLTSLGVGTYKIQYTTSATKFTAQMVAFDENGTEDWWMSGNFDYADTTAAILRLEGRFNGNNDDGNGRRYVRALVSGTTNSAGTLTSANNIEFILFDVGANAGNLALADNVTYMTMKGCKSANCANAGQTGFYVWVGSDSEADDADLSTIGGQPMGTTDNVCVAGLCQAGAGGGLVMDSAPETAWLLSSYVGQTGYETFAAKFAAKNEFTFTALTFDAELN